METKLVSVSSVPLIGKEEITALVEICNRCYFPNKSEKKLFFSKVCDAVGVSQLDQINEEQFEKAFNAARALLYKVGEDVFRSKRTWHKAKRSDLIIFDEAA